MIEWIEIDDAYVLKASGNFNITQIQTGDMIRRYPTTSRYIEAKVIAVPYTTETNLQLFKDITLL